MNECRLPESYTLSARCSVEDDETDIEMRSADEKYTIATVEDRFAPLFIAAPDLLAACLMLVDDPGLTAGANDVIRAAIAKATGK